eukprot:3941422-Rhodomonas_salina.1
MGRSRQQVAHKAAHRVRTADQGCIGVGAGERRGARVWHVQTTLSRPRTGRKGAGSAAVLLESIGADAEDRKMGHVWCARQIHTRVRAEWGYARSATALPGSTLLGAGAPVWEHASCARTLRTSRRTVRKAAQIVRVVDPGCFEVSAAIHLVVRVLLVRAARTSLPMGQGSARVVGAARLESIGADAAGHSLGHVWHVRSTRTRMEQDLDHASGATALPGSTLWGVEAPALECVIRARTIRTSRRVVRKAAQSARAAEQGCIAVGVAMPIVERVTRVRAARTRLRMGPKSARAARAARLGSTGADVEGREMGPVWHVRQIHSRTAAEWGHARSATVLPGSTLSGAADRVQGHVLCARTLPTSRRVVRKAAQSARAADQGCIGVAAAGYLAVRVTRVRAARTRLWMELKSARVVGAARPESIDVDAEDRKRERVWHAGQARTRTAAEWDHAQSATVLPGSTQSGAQGQTSGRVPHARTTRTRA